jgi:adenine-specific DNA glycosylase
MWAFPEEELGEGEVPLAGVARILARVGPQLGAGEKEEARAAERMEPVRHTFTHLRATYLPYRMFWPPPASPSPGWCWVKSGEGDALALPVAQHKILSQIVCVHTLNHRLVLSGL